MVYYIDSFRTNLTKTKTKLNWKDTNNCNKIEIQITTNFCLFKRCAEQI